MMIFVNASRKVLVAWNIPHLYEPVVYHYQDFSLVYSITQRLTR